MVAALAQESDGTQEIVLRIAGRNEIAVEGIADHRRIVAADQLSAV